VGTTGVLPRRKLRRDTIGFQKSVESAGIAEEDVCDGAEASSTITQ
jgi:hypothetical protein